MESTTKGTAVMIDRDGFDRIVTEVIDQQMRDPRLEGIAKLMVPMIGAAFASDIRKKLFGDDQATPSTGASATTEATPGTNPEG